MSLHKITMEISLLEAYTIMQSAKAKAHELKVDVSIAIFDTSGNLRFFIRMDEAPVSSIDNAMKKAKAAMSSGMNAEMVGNSGIPILKDGEPIGYIGVSGGTEPQDGQIATAASGF